jgi:hypothetical protein
MARMRRNTRIVSASACVATAAIVWGCTRPTDSARTETFAFETLAQGLQQGWPSSTYKLQMTISVSYRSNTEVLHCRLTNTSPDAIELNSSELPWKTSHLFHMAAVSATGKVVPRDSIVLQLGGMPRWISVSPNTSLEGDVEIKYLPFQELPRDEDLLLLWSYFLQLDRGADHVTVSGITFLPKPPKR